VGAVSSQSRVSSIHRGAGGIGNHLGADVGADAVRTLTVRWPQAVASTMMAIDGRTVGLAKMMRENDACFKGELTR
jgi:hypothetical protein